MTKRHFEALAATLREQKPDVGQQSAAVQQWECDVRAVAFVALSFNPRFSLQKFFQAAGV